MAKREIKKKSGWLRCGCHVKGETVAFCKVHKNEKNMAKWLAHLREILASQDGWPKPEPPVRPRPRPDRAADPEGWEREDKRYWRLVKAADRCLTLWTRESERARPDPKAKEPSTAAGGGSSTPRGPPTPTSELRSRRGGRPPSLVQLRGRHLTGGKPFGAGTPRLASTMPAPMQGRSRRPARVGGPPRTGRTMALSGK